MLLKDKNAVITGCNRGIGKEIVRVFAENGADIWACVRKESQSFTKYISNLEQKHVVRINPVYFDLENEEHIKACVKTIKLSKKPVNILVNNAQEVPNGLLHDVTDDAFSAGFTSGPLATLRLMKLAYPYLKGDGCIINLASTAAKRWDMSGYGAYAAVKEAIRSLTRAAACEWGADGIRTNVILPHAKSPGLAWWMDKNPEEAAAFQASIPQRRVGECEQDIGRFVVQLCSEGSRYVNGQTIAVDGGQAHLG